VTDRRTDILDANGALTPYHVARPNPKGSLKGMKVGPVKRMSTEQSMVVNECRLAIALCPERDVKCFPDSLPSPGKKVRIKEGKEKGKGQEGGTGWEEGKGEKASCTLTKVFESQRLGMHEAAKVIPWLDQIILYFCIR